MEKSPGTKQKNNGNSGEIINKLYMDADFYKQLFINFPVNPVILSNCMIY